MQRRYLYPQPCGRKSTKPEEVIMGWDYDDGSRDRATEVWEEAPQRSQLLGPNGRPLEYVKQPIGFRLMKKEPARE